MTSDPLSKQQAFSLFEVTRKQLLEYCRWWAKRIVASKGHVTVDDVRAKVNIPPDIDARVLGAVFRTPEWEKTGYTSTTTKSSHGRPIAVFRLITR